MKHFDSNPGADASFPSIPLWITIQSHINEIDNYVQPVETFFYPHYLFAYFQVADRSILQK